MTDNNDKINQLLDKLESLLKRQNDFSREINDLQLEINSQMQIHTILKKIIVPCSKEKAWELLSDPLKLPEITPQNITFTFEEGTSSVLYKNQIIRYTSTSLYGLKISWETKIIDLKYPFFFVDEQLKGPFAYWRHFHYFQEVGKNTVITDHIEYSTSLGFFGRIIHPIVTKPNLIKAFNYREMMIKQKLG
jgi:ligand-binding SRPBCC domain-containing protein